MARLPILLLIFLSVGMYLFGAGSARAAGQELCNETSYILYSAIAFPEHGELVSEGWNRLRPGECRTVLPAPIPPGDYYVFAHSSPSHRGGIRQWSGPSPLCVDIGHFSVAAMANCQNLGLEARGFHVIDGNPPEGRRTIFTETGEFGSRAGLAGLQRLLGDNGLNVRNVDGYAGRRTQIAVRNYLKQMGVAERPSDASLMDMLEKTGAKAIRTTGLEVCNQAEGRIWTAYAHRRGNQWESRGWWSLASGACIQLVNQPISKREKYYIYAGLEQPNGEAGLAAAKETFCISQVKFSIFGRHDCGIRGYLETPFAKVELSKEKLTQVVFTAEDFGGTQTSGLVVQ